MKVIKNISVIIPNWNGKKYLKDCLDSIKKNTIYKNYNIIIVDNGSTDGSQDFIEKMYPFVQLIKRTENGCISKSLNLGIKISFQKNKSNYAYLLNSDVKMKKGWLSEVVRVAENDEKIGIVGSKQLTFDGMPTMSAGWVKAFRIKYYYGSKNKEVGWVSGAGMLIKKEVFDSIGMFDESYSPAYYEETDFEKRALLAGFKIIHCPYSVFLHKGGATSKKLNTTGDFLFSFYRNRIRYFFKYHSKLFFIPRMVKDIIWAIKNKKIKFLFKAYKEGVNSLEK